MENRMTIKFWVPTKPAPGGSKKSFRSATTGKIVTIDDCDDNESWRGVVALYGRLAYQSKPLLTGPLEVSMTFFQRRPASQYGTGKNAGKVKASAPWYPVFKPDALKLARSTEDALTGVIWSDDSQTIALHVTKLYGDKPGVEITVETLPDPRNGR
jgi:Holliday junction resolvase RusA-like endonuclease